MPIRTIGNHQFDARPDRIDYRDRPYNPILVSLPDQYPDPEFIGKYFSDYSDTHGLVLDQGTEGACTGFGLAAVINYLLWKKHIKAMETGEKTLPSELSTVSPKMLYQMARVYDEWPSEDYEGSSCRGAMKGWHRHGVCSKQTWPHVKNGTFVSPKKGWEQEAAKCPLGAYYRINKDSITDMQAAIFEVGAIYVSARVHEGWFLKKSAELPIISTVDGQTGGHAFAITGYTSKGFIVQNSWGPDWGCMGFAILPYSDWIQHGTDAWVVVLGAPVEVPVLGRTWSEMTLTDLANGKAEWFWRSDSDTRQNTYTNKAVEPLSESTAYEHTVVLTNNGKPLNRFLDKEDAAQAVKEAAYTLPLDWLVRNKNTKIAIYAHGGLNEEEASIKRIRTMAPYFRENGIYPLFITWRTGFRESIEGMIEDSMDRFFLPVQLEPAQGWASDFKRKIKDARDRSIEVACEQLLVKPIWMQMKQNAAAGAERNSGLTLIANSLGLLKKKLPGLEIHLVGHSAGSILHGHLLQKLIAKKLAVKTCSLYAPACTVEFALKHYTPAVTKNILSWNSMYFDILSDERERADSVGPYGKSLLYLVSRALEDVHKMPLLGMEAVWDKAVEAENMWHGKTTGDVDNWRKYVAKIKGLTVHGKNRAKVSDGQELIPLAHGSFDNDVDVISATLERILGAKLKVKVERLRDF